MEKICNKCNIPKTLDNFYKIKNGKFGVSADCKLCRSNHNSQFYIKNKQKISKYYKNNKEKILKEKKVFYENNKDILIDYSLNYYKENKENIIIKKKKHYNNNPNFYKEKNKKYRIDNPDYQNIYNKQRKLKDPLFKLSGNIRILIIQSIKKQGFNKTTKTANILGCSFEEFKEYLEKQFDDKMNWDNQGSYWVLDHIKPISLAQNEQEVYDLNHYTNFQPLEKIENIKKGNKYVISYI